MTWKSHWQRESYCEFDCVVSIVSTLETKLWSEQQKYDTPTFLELYHTANKQVISVFMTFHLSLHVKYGDQKQTWADLRELCRKWMWSDWLVPHRLGFCVTDAPASACAFLPASRPLIPSNGGCHLTANLNAATTKLPHLANPRARAPFPTASRLVLGPTGPGAWPPSYTTTASFNHLSLIVLILSVFNYIFLRLLLYAIFAHCGGRRRLLISNAFSFGHKSPSKTARNYRGAIFFMLDGIYKPNCIAYSYVCNILTALCCLFLYSRLNRH